MSKYGQRYAGAVAAFALAAVWVTSGATSGLICLLAAGLGFALVSGAQRLGRNQATAAATNAAVNRHARSTSAETRRRQPERRSRPAEAQKLEPAPPTLVDGALLADGASYGW